MILITALYSVIIAGATLMMDTLDNNYVLTIIISGLIFSALTAREIYKKYMAGFKPKDQNITYRYSTINHLVKISKKPFLFGLEKKVLSDDEFYYDSENFYAVNKDRQSAIFSLKDITELSRTSLYINNSAIWQVKIKNENKELVFKFAHNYTIWNKSFLDFYEKVKILNPSAVKTKWSLWRM